MVPENSFSTHTTLKDDIHSISLFPTSSYFIDRSETYNINTIDQQSSWVHIKKDTINFGILPTPLWVHSIIDGRELSDLSTYYLRFTNSEISKIDVFVNGALASSTGQKSRQRDASISGTGFIIPISIPAKRITHVYFRLQTTGSLRTALTIHSDTDIIALESDRKLIVGLYYGLATILCLYFFVFCLYSKENIYLWISISVASLILLQLNLDGYLQQVIYPESPQLFFLFVLIPTLLAYISTFLVAIDFFYLEVRQPILHKLLQWHVYWGIILLCLCLLLTDSSMLYLVTPYIFSGGIVCIITCLTNLGKGNSSAVYYIFAMTLASIGSILYISLYIGLLPSHPMLESIFKSSSTIEFALITISLFRRYQESQLTLTKERKRILESLITANKIKDEFLMVVSHELRTPMNGIEGALELVKDYQLPERANKYLNMAQHSSADMVVMINNILDYIEINDTIEVRNENFNLVSDLRNLVDTMHPRLLSQGTVININCSEDTASIYQGDSKLLFKIFRHILSNAMKFTSNGTIDININTVNKGDCDNVEIAFQDTGVGIPPSHLEDIFEGFRQQDLSMVRDFQGLGLGLSISKAFATALSASLAIESKIDKGTLVTLSLPLKVIERKHAKKDLREETTNTLNMLVVEDNIVNSKILVAILKKLGYPSTTAENGLLAIEKAKSSQFDVIWMDCQMPVMDGLEATRQIRQLSNYQKTPIIAVTANAFSQDEVRCLESGMSGFLAKPVNKIAIEKAVERWGGTT